MLHIVYDAVSKLQYIWLHIYVYMQHKYIYTFHVSINQVYKFVEKDYEKSLCMPLRKCYVKLKQFGNSKPTFKYL